jgi:cytochrome c553
MKTILFGLILGLVCIVSVAAPQQGIPNGQPLPKDPGWAFPVQAGTLPAEPPGNKNIPDSTLSFTQARIDDLLNPPDWFPQSHAPAPQIVKYGHGDALACGACHLMNGQGHPESADLAGAPAAYVVQQMADFKSGARKDYARMNGIVQALSDAEILAAAEYFASIKPIVFTKVVEQATVPKTVVLNGRMRFAAPDGGTEPIGNRIITLPQEPERVTKRDPRSGFIAYAPPGSLAKGEQLVKNGGNGKTIACTVCHGDNLLGLGNVPRIAGLHPIYIARQLYLIQDGRRNGPDAQLMKKPVEKLTDEDIVSISAYLASLPVSK